MKQLAAVLIASAFSASTFAQTSTIAPQQEGANVISTQQTVAHKTGHKHRHHKHHGKRVVRPAG